MTKPIVHKGVEWQPHDEGEYNEHLANINGHNCSVWSDRDGIKWEVGIDGEWIESYCDTMLEAMSLAKMEAEENQ